MERRDSNETGVKSRGFSYLSTKFKSQSWITEAREQKATVNYRSCKMMLCQNNQQLFAICPLNVCYIWVVHYFLLIKILSTIVVKMLVFTDVPRSSGQECMPTSNVPWIYKGGIHRKCLDHEIIQTFHCLFFSHTETLTNISPGKIK